MPNDPLSSGFIGTDIPSGSEELFTDIKELSGHTSGYSRLYQCRRYGKACILKALAPAYRDKEPYETLLRKEFEIGYELDHPHICHTLGWMSTPETGNCILLEYIDGITLSAFMQQGRLTRPLARRLITELCGALHYMHSKQVVHRDLKPENILITHNGSNAKLIDFGLADRDDFEVGKIPGGTLSYLAPEQIQKEASWDCRTDIYSLGVLIRDMGALLSDRPLRHIAEKCMQANPARRYASVDELVQALNRKPQIWPYYAGGVLLLLLIAIPLLWSSRQENQVLPDTHTESASFYGNTVRSLANQESFFIRQCDSIARLHNPVEATPR